MPNHEFSLKISAKSDFVLWRRLRTLCSKAKFLKKNNYTRRNEEHEFLLEFLLKPFLHSKSLPKREGF